MGEKFKTLLIVDDEIEILDIFSMEFSSEGYEVFTASNLEQAMQILEQQSLDVIFSDIRMPNGDGKDLLKKVNLMTGKKPDFYFVSGFADFTEAEALEMGAKGLLSKPVSLKTLYQILEG